MMHVVVPVWPDPASKAQKIRAGRGDRGCDFSIAQKEGTSKLLLAKVIVNVMTSNNMERVITFTMTLVSDSLEVPSNCH